MFNNRHIDMPEDWEIQKEIDTIIVKGITENHSFFTYIKKMYTEVGLKYLFHDKVEIVFSLFIIFFAFALPSFSRSIFNSMDNGLIYIIIALLSPLCYLIIASIAFVNTRINDTFQIEMTCKYTIYQLAALRMLVFSILSVLFNTSLLYIINANYQEIDFLRGFMISMTSLFLFSVIFLYLLIIVRSIFIKYLIIIGWGFSHLLFGLFKTQLYITCLINIPIYIYLGATLVCIWIYIKKLKKLMTFKSIEGGV